VRGATRQAAGAARGGESGSSCTDSGGTYALRGGTRVRRDALAAAAGRAAAAQSSQRAASAQARRRAAHASCASELPLVRAPRKQAAHPPAVVSRPRAGGSVAGSLSRTVGARDVAMTAARFAHAAQRAAVAAAGPGAACSAQGDAEESCLPVVRATRGGGGQRCRVSSTGRAALARARAPGCRGAAAAAPRAGGEARPQVVRSTGRRAGRERRRRERLFVCSRFLPGFDPRALLRAPGGTARGRIERVREHARACCGSACARQVSAPRVVSALTRRRPSARGDAADVGCQGCPRATRRPAHPPPRVLRRRHASEPFPPDAHAPADARPSLQARAAPDETRAKP
jgi:hypothetical protein